MISASPLVFIDTNVLLDVLLPDRPRFVLASQFISNSPSLAISALSVHLAVHFGKKFHLQPDNIKTAIELLAVLPIEQTTLQWAFTNLQNTDFEDAIQVACAVLSGCSQFVTSDVALAKNYSQFINVQLLS